MVKVAASLHDMILPFRTAARQRGDAMVVSNIKTLVTIAINSIANSNFEDEYRRASALIEDAMAYMPPVEAEYLIHQWVIMCNEISEFFERTGYIDYNEVVVIDILDDDRVLLSLC